MITRMEARKKARQLVERHGSKEAAAATIQDVLRQLSPGAYLYNDYVVILSYLR